uniref:PID domain-containing protein n=2 Tax=Steinernema glaseri TaxID=37863 RepID=A0A1I7XWL2_9BILA
MAPPEYPKLFCWVYKHEGKRMKPELRCHAVLCRKASEPAQIAARLQETLQTALLEYKREKMAMERARRSSTASGGSGSCPRRKLILQTGSLNFRPPVSRSKSAPRLGSIDEEDEMDEELEEEEENFSDWGSLRFRDTPVGDDASSSSGSFVASSRVSCDEEPATVAEEEPSPSHFRRKFSMTTRERETKRPDGRSFSLEEPDGASSSSGDDLGLGTLVDDAMSDESGYPDSMRTASSGGDKSAGSSSHGEDDLNLFYSDEELIVLEEDLCDRMRELLAATSDDLATSV